MIPEGHPYTSVKLGTAQRRLAWPVRKDDMRKSRSVNNYYNNNNLCVGTLDRMSNKKQHRMAKDQDQASERFTE